MDQAYVIDPSRPAQAKPVRLVYLLTSQLKKAKTPVGGTTPAGYTVKMVGGKRQYTKAKPRAKAQMGFTFVDPKHKEEKPHRVTDIQEVVDNLVFTDAVAAGATWQDKKRHRGREWVRENLPKFNVRTTKVPKGLNRAEMLILEFAQMSQRKIEKKPNDPFWQGVRDAVLQIV